MLSFELTKDTPYLALSGELWSVFYEYFNRNWSCYKGFLLYLSDSPSVEPTPGSTDRTQGVCGVVGLDCADGLEREIERHPATHTYWIHFY